MIVIDICGLFPTSDRGKKYILVAADYFTKWPECWAIAYQEAKTVAHCIEEFISRHGTPQVLLTDQGRNFESQVIAEVCNLLHINKTHTTAYHPLCDGQVERFNRTLANMLAMYVNKNQKDWDLWLEQVLFEYRTSIRKSSGATPFSLLYCFTSYSTIPCHVKESLGTKRSLLYVHTYHLILTALSMSSIVDKS